MKKLSNIFLAICVITALAGFADLGPATVSGFLRAIAAVFFILTFIVHLMEKAEAEEETKTTK